MVIETGRIGQNIGPLRKKGDFYIGIRRNVKDGPFDAPHSKINFLSLKEIGVVLLTLSLIRVAIPIAQALLH